MKTNELIKMKRKEKGLTLRDIADVADAYVLRAGGWATPHVMQKVYRHALDDIHLEMSKKAVEAFQNSLQNA